MGLDVYLNTVERSKAQEAYSKAWEEAYESGWDDLTDEEKKAFREKWPWPSQEDVPSQTNPEHLFNKAYLRSSYNEGGFEAVVPPWLAKPADEEAEEQESGVTNPENYGSLAWIFEPVRSLEPSDYDIQLAFEHVPYLHECHARAAEVARGLGALRETGALKVSQLAAPFPGRELTKQEAITFAQDALSRQAFGGDGGWTNGIGTYFGKEGLQVIAAIPAKRQYGFDPMYYLVYRASQDDLQWYHEAALIVGEFINYAIELVERDGSAELVWSG